MPNNPNPPQQPEPDNFGMPENWAPIDAPPIIPGSPSGGPPPTPSGRDQYNSGPLPPNFGLSPSLVKTNYGGGVGEVLLMPVQGGPGDNAKTVSIVTQAINAIPHVVIPPAAKTATPPLISLVDEFMSGQAAAANIATVGSLGWDVYANAGAAQVYLRGTVPPNLGVMVLDSTTSPNSGTGIVLQANGSEQTGLLPLWEFAGWSMNFKFSIPVLKDIPTSGAEVAQTTAKTRFYLGAGYGTPGGMAAGRPQKFVGLQFDTDTTIVNTTYHYETHHNTAVNVNTTDFSVDSGVTPLADGSWHLFTMSSTVVGTITFSIDGAAIKTITTLQASKDSTAITTAGRNNNFSQWGGIAAGFSVLPGQSFTVTGANAGFNGTFVSLCPSGGSLIFAQQTGGNVVPVGSVGTITAWNSYLPMCFWGNDSTSAPAVSKTFLLDHFDFSYTPQ